VGYSEEYFDMALSHRRERILNLLRSRAITVGLVVIAGVICVALGREVARRVTVQREIDRLTKDITAAEQSTQDLDRLLATLKSTTYEEGAARTYLNLQKPGENVLVVPDLNTENVNSVNETPNKGSDQDLSTADETNSKKWWDFIFHSSPT
jgi:hypothetical protein